MGEENKTETKKLTFKGIMKKPYVWGAIALIVLAPILYFALKTVPDISEDNETETVTEETTAREENIPVLDLSDSALFTSVAPQKLMGKLIEPDTEFVLTSIDDLDVEMLKSSLSLSPDVPYTLTKTAPKTYTLKSEGSLPMGEIVQLVLKDSEGNARYKWAFQTTDVFEICSVFPADNSSYANISTGIEITFTNPVSKENAADYFEISPKIDGHFESYHQTLVFVPDEKLTPSTSYKVTVKAGLPSAAGIPLSEEVSFRFSTSEGDSNNYFYFYNNMVSETFVPGEQALIKLRCSEELREKDIQVSLYQYKGYSEYENALKQYAEADAWYSQYKFPTDGLDCIYENTEKLLTYGYSSYVLMPENLEQGWYLADVRTSVGGVDYHLQRNIQINPISVYSSTLPKQMSLFINDTVTGETAIGAEVTFNYDGKTVKGITDNNGTLILDLDATDSGKGILNITYDGYTYGDTIRYSGKGYYPEYGIWGKQSGNEDYYMYIYTDREIYRTTDTINVWGVMLPRYDRINGYPENLAITLGYEETVYNPEPIKINPDGTFMVTLSIKNYEQNSWCPIRIVSDGETLLMKGVMIGDFVKPAFVLETQSPIYAFRPQENKVGISLTASYFDGTVADGLNFDVRGDIAWNESAVTTDSKGYTKTEVLIPDQNTWKPVSTNVSFELNGIQNEYQSANGKFYSVFRDVMLVTDSNVSEGVGSLRVEPHLVDATAIDSRPGNYYYSDYDRLKGASVDTEVTAVLNRSWYEKVSSGTYYDFIEKKNVEKYTYQYRREVVGTYVLKTINGTGVFDNLPITEKGSEYYVELSWKDTYGGLVEETVYMQYEYYYNTPYSYYGIISDKSTFTENENVNFKLIRNGFEVEKTNGRIFYTVAHSMYLKSDVVSGNQFDILMTDEFIPNVDIRGAYFDGKHVFEISPQFTTYSFDPKERALVLDVKADKEKYLPSEDSKISVTVKDVNGKIMPNTTVSLSLVDEAIFAIRDQKAEPLKDIYRTITHPYPSIYVSYHEYILGEEWGSEKGGGDGTPSIRKDFKDTAAFLTATTNADGIAIFEVTLPDNLTSWRATVQAVYKESVRKIYAGATTKSVIVTLPLFINPIMLPKYLEGDDISVSATCDGEVMGEIDITARLTGSGIDKTLTAGAGKAINFGKLPLGSYKILFTASDGVNSDAIELPFEVLETMLETHIVRKFDMLGGFPDITPTRYPVTFAFYDKEYLLNSDIISFLTGSYSERLDCKLASALTQRELGYMTEEYFIDRFDMSGSTRFPSLFSYSEEDLYLTSLISITAPELFDRKVTIARLNSKLSSSEVKVSEAANCYLALSALQAPVLLDVRELMGTSYDTGVINQIKLKLCISLALLGDYDNALLNYKKITQDFFFYSITDDGSAKLKGYIDFGKSDIQGDTKLALMAASILNLPEADYMARYLVESKPEINTYALELMTYIKNYKPKSVGNAQIEYNFNGKTEKISLNHYYGHTVSFGEEQLKNADFKVINGSVCGNIYYTGAITEEAEEPILTVKKTYTLDDASAGWVPGALVKVEINILGGNSKSGYTIDDVIPSCARYAYDDNKSNSITRNGQYITGNIYNFNVIRYYIRLVSAGGYATDTAVVRSYNGDWGMSEGGMINVSEK